MTKCEGYTCSYHQNGLAYCVEGLKLLLLGERLEFKTPCGKKIRLYVEDEAEKANKEAEQ